MTKEDMRTDGWQWLMSSQPPTGDGEELRWATWLLGKRRKRGRRMVVLWLRQDDALSPCAATALSLIGARVREAGGDPHTVAAVTPPAFDDMVEHAVAELGSREQFDPQGIPEALRSLAGSVLDGRLPSEIEPYIRRGGLIDGIFAAAASVAETIRDEEAAKYGAYSATCMQAPEDAVRKLRNRGRGLPPWH